MSKTPWYKREVSLGRSSRDDLVAAIKNFALMLDSGMPVVDALSILSEESSGSLRRAFVRLVHEVEAGSSLGDSLELVRGVFDPIVISAVKTGEPSGTLAQNMMHVAEQVEHDQRVRRNIRAAFIYPSLILFATLVLGFVVGQFVFPQLSNVFASLNVELPWTTRVVLFLSDVFARYGMWLFVLLLALLGFVAWFLRRPFLRPVTDRVVLRLPLIGTFIHEINRARFCRALGTLLQSGVSVFEALEVSQQTLPNRVYRTSVNDFSSRISTGETLEQAMERHSDLYPPMIRRMIAVGERTGSLTDTSLYLARYFEERVDLKAKNFSTIIEPILVILIGAAVGFVAISIFSPVYSILSGLSL